MNSGSPLVTADATAPRTAAGDAPALQFWNEDPYRIAPAMTSVCFQGNRKRAVGACAVSAHEFGKSAGDSGRYSANERQAMRLPYNFGTKSLPHRAGHDVGLFQGNPKRGVGACAVSAHEFGSPLVTADATAPGAAGDAPALQFWERIPYRIAPAMTSVCFKAIGKGSSGIGSS
jgi:hypothetical protein